MQTDSILDKLDLYIQPSIFEKYKGVQAAQSTRHGGCSTGYFSTLNLSLYTKDLKEDIMENRRRFFTALGFEEENVAGGYQVHGDKVQIVEEPGQTEGYDAFITNKKGLLLTATIADCVPILIYDQNNQAVAAIHAGWKGTVARIVAKTLDEMAIAYGTTSSDCLAYIGTCIDFCSFEVDEDVAQHFGNSFKEWKAEQGKYYVDLKAANTAILIEKGLPENQIEVSPYCTVVHRNHFFSHRAEKGLTGRMLAAIGIQK